MVHIIHGPLFSGRSYCGERFGNGPGIYKIMDSKLDDEQPLHWMGYCEECEMNYKRDRIIKELKEDIRMQKRLEKKEIRG